MKLLEVEEAAIWDVLSILQVKLEECKDLNLYPEIDKQHQKLLNSIKKQFGEDIYKKVFYSQEYWDLYMANSNIFQGVNLAKQNLISGYDLDSLNCKRFAAKKLLQEKHFNQELKEVKFTT